MCCMILLQSLDCRLAAFSFWLWKSLDLWSLWKEANETRDMNIVQFIFFRINFSSGKNFLHRIKHFQKTKKKLNMNFKNFQKLKIKREAKYPPIKHKNNASNATSVFCLFNQRFPNGE